MSAASSSGEASSDGFPTPLVELPELARVAGVRRVFVKDESARRLGNFKILGGMAAGVRAIARSNIVPTADDRFADRVQGRPVRRLICASFGNHGLSVSMAAQLLGIHASVYLPAHTSPVRLARIEAAGGEVVPVTGGFDDAVRAAEEAAASGGGTLIPDTCADPDDPVVRDVITGYARIAEELVGQFGTAPPSHLYIQAGVGGLAAALVQGLHGFMAEPRGLVVVEPMGAPCVARALEAGHPVPVAVDPGTAAEMLCCGQASAPAIQILRRHAILSTLVDETELIGAVEVLRAAGGPATTPSGAAGLAGLLHAAADPDMRDVHRIGPGSDVLLVVTEGSLQ